MLKTAIGLILLLSPFLLIFKYKNKKIGFANIVSFLIILHLSIALITQTFSVFTYPVVTIINLIVFLIVIIIIGTGFKKMFFKTKLNLRKADWVLIFVLLIAFISLFSVHFNYSGKITTITTFSQEVENMQYPYPYFSDEWYNISFIKNSINTHQLPFKYPLMQESATFTNLEFVFHSFLSELFLLLNLDPLTNYTVLTIFFNLLIICLVYIFLRANAVNKLAAGIISLSLLYITNGANLPGIWNLLPLSLGIISIILSFFFVFSNNSEQDAQYIGRSARYNKIALLMAFIALLFYPPLFPFCALTIIFSNLTAKSLPIKEKFKNILYFLILTILVAIALLLAFFSIKGSLDNFFNYAFSKVFFPHLPENAIDQYSPIYVIPIPILILAALGIWKIIKKKTWLAIVLLSGITYWILYSFQAFRLFISYPRVVFFTAILITITAGFGLNYLLKLLKKINFIREKENILKFTQIGILILFLILSFNYTSNETWQKLKLVYPDSKTNVSPAAPANNYLQPDDLRLFSNIKHKTFLSLPWKGTVIGIATDNFPKGVKSGVITSDSFLSQEFMQLNCTQKKQIARAYGIDYVYLPKFNCPNFQLIDKSEEELYLYKFEEI